MTILEDLAAGRIDAAEAARRIDALKAQEPAPESPAESAPEQTDQQGEGEFDAGRPQFATHAREVFRHAEEAEPVEAEVVEETPAEEPVEKPGRAADPVDEDEDVPTRTTTGARGVTKVVVRAVGRRVRIVGDASVATLSADGPHVLRRTGKTLEVTSDGEIGPSFGGFSIIRPPRSVDDLRTLGFGKELLIRVNPVIPVDVEVTGGGLAVTDVPVLGKVRVTVGSCTIDGVNEIEDALVQTGSATVKGDICQGRSRVRVESGALTVVLGEKSNVTVRAESQLGRVVWPGEPSGKLDEYVAGNGSARLDVGVVMGQASIKDAADHEEKGRR